MHLSPHRPQHRPRNARQRRVLRRTCFSIEPGIYRPAFGVRSEINVLVDAAGEVYVTGAVQDSLLPIFEDA
jgi:Xaa-Pro dipeptidase